MAIITAETIEEVKEIVKTRTAAAIADGIGVLKPTEEEPEYVKNIREVLKSSSLQNHFPGIGLVMSSLLEAATGKKYNFAMGSEDGIEYNYRKYNIVIADEQPEGRGSTYEPDSAFLVTLRETSKGNAVAAMRSADQGPGNTHYGRWHLATPEEIDEFFNSLSEDSKAAILRPFKE